MAGSGGQDVSDMIIEGASSVYIVGSHAVEIFSSMYKSCIRIAEIEEGHGPPGSGIRAVLLHPASFELDGAGRDVGCFRARRPLVRSLASKGNMYMPRWKIA